jgi:hypothetical protein
MLGALSQLEVSSDIWEQVLQQALDILPELVDEPLAALMSFVFKAAAESQQLLRAVCSVVLLNIYLFTFTMGFLRSFLFVFTIQQQYSYLIDWGPYIFLQFFDQVAAVRRRFKKLGPAVSPRVLDVVRSTVSSNTDVAEALLRDIDNDSDRSETDITSAGINMVFGDNRDGDGAAQLQVCSISSCSGIVFEFLGINYVEDVGFL